MGWLINPGYMDMLLLSFGLILWLSVASSNQKTVYLIDFDDKDRIYDLLLIFPKHKFSIFTQIDLDISEYNSMGYEINSIISKNPLTRGLDSLYENGGILLQNDFNIDQLNDELLSEIKDKVILFKRKSERSCNWCINGYFVIDNAFIAAPPLSPLIKSVKDGGLDVYTLTNEVKRNIKSCTLKADKSLNTGGKIRVGNFQVLPCFSKSYLLSKGLRIISKAFIQDAAINTEKGVFNNGSKSLRFQQISQANLNRELSALKLLNVKGSSKLTISMDGEILEIPFYDLGSLVTIIVKTFGRMEKVLDLVSSSRNMYPDVEIIVGNDGADAHRLSQGRHRGFSYVSFPYDIGLSEGRNRLIQMVKTPFVLFLDDDFILTERSDLTLLVHELHKGKFDILGGQSPICETIYSGKMRTEGERLILEQGFDLVYGSSCNRVDIIPNLFMTRVSLLKERILWDSNFKVGEHEDFFWRAKKLGLRIGSCPDVSFDHIQVKSEEQNSEYKEKRERAHLFQIEMLKKHGFSELIAFGKQQVKLQPISPIKRIKISSIFPFSSSIILQTSLANPFYVIDLLDEKGINIRSTKLSNPNDLIEIHFPFNNLEPDSVYIVRLKPGNYSIISDKIASIKFRTLDFFKNNLIRNPAFDGTTGNWKSPMNCKIGLIPLFFPKQDPNHSQRLGNGDFIEHIEGRSSQWAFSNSKSKLDRNYAIFVITPALDSFASVKPVYRLSQTFMHSELKCRFNCSIKASAWIRVDKIWGEKRESSLRLEISIRKMGMIQDENFIKAFGVDQIQSWQYAEIETVAISDSSEIERITYSLSLSCNRGAFYADDLYMEMSPKLS